MFMEDNITKRRENIIETMRTLVLAGQMRGEERDENDDTDLRGGDSD